MPLGEHSIGKIFVELDLDPSRYVRGQKKLYKDAVYETEKIEENWRKVGETSDAILNMQEARARKGYNAIANHAKSSTEEIYRAEKALATKLEAIDKQRYARKYDMMQKDRKAYETLGMMSTAEYRKRVKEARDAYTRIKGHAQSTADDIVRAERAKNRRIKQLNDEMVGHHEKSWAGVARAILRAYATYFIIQNVVRGLAIPFKHAFLAVDEFNQAVASTAAMVTTFAERPEGMTLAGHFEQALRYAQDIVPVIEDIAAKTLMSGEEATALAMAFQRAGVFLNKQNEEQVRSFTQIANALPLLTQGQEIMRQINSEIRAVMSGANAQTSMLLQTLRAQYPEIDKQLKAWRASGTVLENLGKLLEGFAPATELLENQWQAVRSTIETTVKKILREGMGDAYDRIIESIQEVNKHLEKNRDEIAPAIHTIFEDIATVTERIEKAIKNIAENGENVRKTYEEIKTLLQITSWLPRMQWRAVTGAIKAGAGETGFGGLADDETIRWAMFQKKPLEALERYYNIKPEDVHGALVGQFAYPTMEGFDIIPKDPGPTPKEIEAAKKRAEKRAALEAEFQKKLSMAQTEGLDRRLAQLHGNYLKQREKAKKLGADMLELELWYQLKRDELIQKHNEKVLEHQDKHNIKFQEQRQHMIELNIDATTEEFFREIDELEKLYDQTHEDVVKASEDALTSILTNFEGGWEDTMDNIKDYFFRTMAEMVSKQYIVPIIAPITMSMVGQMADMLGFGNQQFGASGLMSLMGMGGLASRFQGFLGTPLPFIGGPGGAGLQMAAGPGGTQVFATGAGATYGSMLSGAGWGYMGYNLLGGMLGLPQGGQAGIGSGVGGAIGSIFGPLGTALGALAGGFLGSMFGREDKYTAFKVKGARGPLGLEDTFESYWGGSWLNEKLDYAIRDIMVPAVDGMIADVANIIGFLPEQMQKEFEDILFNIPGAKISRKDIDAGVAAWLEKIQGSITEQLYETALAAGFESEAAFDEFVAKLQMYGQKSGEMLIKGFKDAMETGDWATFERSMQDSVYNAVLDGFINAVTQSTVFKNLFQSVFMGIDDAMTQAFEGGSFDLLKFYDLAAPHLSAVTSTLAEVAPAFDAIMATMTAARDMIYDGNYDLADSANKAASETEKLIEQLQGLSQTIDDWLASLMISDLAPAMSVELWANQYEQLRTAAAASTAEAEEIQSYLSYATDYLRMMQGYGTLDSYQDIYSSVVQDVRAVQAMKDADIMNLQSGLGVGGGTTITQEELRIMLSEWSGVIAEVIESQPPIQVTVQVDENEIGNVVAEQIPVNFDIQEMLQGFVANLNLPFG